MTARFESEFDWNIGIGAKLLKFWGQPAGIELAACSLRKSASAACYLPVGRCIRFYDNSGGSIAIRLDLCDFPKR
jgi:hypothetical protein